MHVKKRASAGLNVSYNVEIGGRLMNLNSANQITAQSFKSSSMDKVNVEQMNSPGLYTVADTFGPSQSEGEKHKSILGSLVSSVLKLAVLGVAIVGARKLLLKGEIAKAPEGVMGKAKAWFQHSADFIEKYTWTPIKNLLGKNAEAEANTATPK